MSKLYGNVQQWCCLVLAHSTFCAQSTERTLLAMIIHRSTLLSLLRITVLIIRGWTDKIVLLYGRWKLFEDVLFLLFGDRSSALSQFTIVAWKKFDFCYHEVWGVLSTKQVMQVCKSCWPELLLLNAETFIWLFLSFCPAIPLNGCIRRAMSLRIFAGAQHHYPIPGACCMAKWFSSRVLWTVDPSSVCHWSPRLSLS